MFVLEFDLDLRHSRNPHPSFFIFCQFNGPKPVIMDVASTQELVLMLQGAKRSSRIEFGAHQVNCSVHLFLSCKSYFH